MSATTEWVEELRQIERDLSPHWEDDGLLGRAWAFAYRTLVGIEASRERAGATPEQKESR